MAKTPSITPDEARRAAQSLRKFWKAGTRSLARLDELRAKNPDAYRHGTKQEALAAEAGKEGLNPDTMKKAWRVAQEYEESHIEALCKLVERHTARFGPTHLVRLLAVQDRPRRDALAKEAIESRWGSGRLEMAVLGQHRRRPLVGKRPRVPDDGEARLVALEGLCIKWTRWCEAASADLPDEIRPLVTRATAAVKAVREALDRKHQGRTGKATTPGRKDEQ